MSMAITDLEAFLKGNVQVLLDIEAGIQRARVGSQYPDVAAEQCQIPSEFVAGTDGPAVKVSGVNDGIAMEDSRCSIKGCLQGNHYLFYEKPFQFVAKPYINFPAVRSLGDCLFG
jgi:hypothetical protein